MEIELTERAKQDLTYWKKIGNEQVLKKIRELTASILENSYQGIGNPEAFKASFIRKMVNKNYTKG